MKPDVGRESRFLPTPPQPPAFDALVRGLCRNIAITFGMEKLHCVPKKTCDYVFDDYLN